MDENEKKEIKFPCPRNNNKYTTLYQCEHCNYSTNCDIYPTMIDEDFN